MAVRIVCRAAGMGCAVLMMASCAQPSLDTGPAPAPAVAHRTPAAEAALPPPRIIAADAWLECVVYARATSGIQVFGDAGTWWEQAAGRYERGSSPQTGAVLAFRPAHKSTGHVAVVSRVVSDRVILASHANWLNQGRIHENTPVRDVSERGDWTAVRVWYTPGQAWGARVYPTHGFIYPSSRVAADR